MGVHWPPYVKNNNNHGIEELQRKLEESHIYEDDEDYLSRRIPKISQRFYKKNSGILKFLDLLVIVFS